MPKRDEWIERLVAYLGPEIPPIAARVLGVLLICVPPEQTAAQIAAAVGASRASLTTSLQLLTRAGLVTKLTRKGERTALYRLAPGAWQSVVARQIASISVFIGIANDGIALVERGGDQSRLKEAVDVFEWMDAAFKQAPPMPGGDRS